MKFIFDNERKLELASLVKEDILSKWNPEEESLYEFLEYYISEDILDYQNATKLNLIWNIKEYDESTNDFIVEIEVVD